MKMVKKKAHLLLSPLNEEEIAFICVMLDFCKHTLIC